MTVVHRRYHALLEVSNILNSQRKMDDLWQACTECIKEVISWERAGVLLYAPEEDGFRFHALETNMPKRVLQRGAIIREAAVRWDGFMTIRRSMFGLTCSSTKCSSKISIMRRKVSAEW